MMSVREVQTHATPGSVPKGSAIGREISSCARLAAPSIVCGFVFATLDITAVVRAGHAESLSVPQVAGLWLTGVLVLMGWSGLMGTGLVPIRAWFGQRGALRPQRLPFYAYVVGVMTCVTVVIGAMSYVPLWSSTAVRAISPVVLVVLGCACGLGTGVAVLSRKRRNAATLAVMNIVGCYWFLVDSLYMFSRYGSIKYLHSAGFLAYLAFVHVSLECALGQRRAMPLRRWGLTLLTYGALIMATSIAVLCMSNTARVVLYERTAMTYRGLALSPKPVGGSSPTIEALDSACDRLEATASPPSLSAQATPVGTLPTTKGVLTVLVDSLRTDRLEVKRNGLPLMPRLREFRDRAVSVTHAYANYPGTTLSVRGMVTGKFVPPRTGHRSGPGLGEVLQQASVRTNAIIVHENLKDALGPTFDYDMTLEESRLPDGKKALTSRQVAQRALDAIARFQQSDERFFVLAHFYDPHSHYVTNEVVDFGKSEIERYDAEVHYTDHWIGWLFDQLEQERLVQDLAVVVISDHGEEFWDHGYVRHQFRLYDESAKIVFMVALPGSTGRGREIMTPSSGVDFFSTILHLYGMPAPEAVDGVSVLALEASRRDGDMDRVVPMQSSNAEKVGLVSRSHKLIINQALSAVEYYDLATDPAERSNVADQRPTGLSEDYCRLRSWARTEGLWQRDR